MGNNCLYHYTLLDALPGILQKNRICLWATRYDCLNDPNEQIWASNVIKPFLVQESKLNEQEFDELYSKFTYVLSFCKIHDYSNMWRRYCNDGRGVSLGIDCDIIFQESEKHKKAKETDEWDMFMSVTYSSRDEIKVKFEEAQKVHDEWYENISDSIDNKCEVFPFIKNDIFNIEEEYRYVRIKDNIMYGSPSKGVFFEEDRSNVKYRKRDNRIIPYCEISFPIAALKTITIGYGLEFDSCKKSILNLLEQFDNAYCHVKIEKSLSN